MRETKTVVENQDANTSVTFNGGVGQSSTSCSIGGIANPDLGLSVDPRSLAGKALGQPTGDFTWMHITLN